MTMRTGGGKDRTSLTIRESVANDVMALQALYRELYPHSKNLHVVPERLDQIRADPANDLFVYDEGGSILGTIFVTLWMDPANEFEPYAVTANVIVHEDVGGGGRLLRHVEAFCVALYENYAVKAVVRGARFIRLFVKHGYDGDISWGFKKYFRIEPIDTE